MTPYERAVELARKWAGDPLLVIVLKAMATAMLEAVEIVRNNPIFKDIDVLEKRAAEYEKAAKEGR